ncbi:MAG TPA: tetratricopeptide repeat protein, partial [Cellvibrionaceae bacterium]|nr:tetratricopeptide repeat protein [Cellvibrionaceae bacterium]
QQAQSTRDPEVVARACRLARFVNQREQALALCSLWVEVSPNLVEARQAALAELLQANRLQEAFAQAEFLVSSGEESGLDVLAARAAQQSVAGTPQLVNDLVPLYENLISRYPSKTEVLLGASYLLQRQNKPDAALEMARRGLKLKPDDIGLLSQESRLLLGMNRTEEAHSKIKRLLELQPDNQRLRLQYAKSLAATNLPEAQQQLAVLLNEAPEDSDLNLAMGLVLLEQNKLGEAEPLFKKVSQSRHGGSAQYYLGRIYNQQKDYPRAIEALKAVPPGPDYLPAQGQLILALQKAGRGEEALKELDRAGSQLTPQAQPNIALLKANLLADMGRGDEAIALLTQSLSQNPTSADLLYGRAMIFSRLNNEAAAEVDLRAILASNPNHPATLNALGYGMSKNPARLAEAKGYVEQALQLAPDDPSIMDSLGWIYLQQGKLNEALKLLKQAYSRLADPEIGAHLGEALWRKGNKADAKVIWRQIRSEHPNSEPLRQTLQRLNITLD